MRCAVHLPAAVRQCLQLREGQVATRQRDVATMATRMEAGTSIVTAILLLLRAPLVVVIVAAALHPPGRIRLLLLQQGV